MSRQKTGFAAVLLVSLSMSLAGQEKQLVFQTPRQAVIEMFTGGQEAFRKHLTLEVQAKLAGLLQASPSAASQLQTFVMAKAAGPQLQSFEFGTILLYAYNAEQHERIELDVDSDNLRDDQDDMAVSVHSFHSGVEQEMPVTMRFLLNLKLQDGIWRLNAITFNARLPLGDPRILDRSWWSVPGLEIPGMAMLADPAKAEERPKIEPLRAVHLLALAENLYAQKHPEMGFTCRIADLVNVGKGLDNGESYTFMDPEFAGGVYNGYKFALSGCAGKPAKTFKVSAEPVKGGSGRAFCSDNTYALRASEDGHAANCLVAGRITRR